jgi:hypothetical protein
VSDVRVWAEEREGSELLLTWEWPADEASERDHDSDARSAAAMISVHDGVHSAAPGDGGVIVVFDSDRISKQAIAAAIRSALALDEDLRSRSNSLLKRLPKYASLAASLALDERLSPVPEVARQTALRRTATPLRVIPGFPLISQLHSLIPMLRSLRSWSRTAAPEDVEQHFVKAGLSRDQLDRDLATALEALAFARSYAMDTATKVAARAATAATQARSITRDWVKKQQDRNGPSSEE